MSEVGSRTRLSPGASQLPVAWYFDEKLFEQEKKLIFDAGPGYVGHELMVPEVHDYRSQEWHDHARLVTHQPDGYYEMSNVCRHRQAIMLQGAGNAKNTWPSRNSRTGRACCSRARARRLSTSPA